VNATALLAAEFVVARRSFEVAATISLEAGERLSLYGPSGAGKTTCLEAVAGTAVLRGGEVRLGGELVNAPPGSRRREVLEPRDRAVAFVRQPTTLFPHLDVGANVGYGRARAEARSAPGVAELLGDVGLGGLGAVMPDALSGGQRQRVSLARAVARPFRALLLDEPFSAVDVASRPGLRAVAEAATAREGAVAVLVTHDLSEAQAFGDLLGIMDEGHLLQVGPSAEVVRRPASRRVAALCGYESFLAAGDGRLVALHPDRFLEGAFSDRGVVLRGTVRTVRPYGARFACELAPVELPPPWSESAGHGGAAGAGTGDPVLAVRLDSAPRPGDPLEVTALDPPFLPAR